MTNVEKMINCPNCHKPILNDGQFSSFAKFNLKCPWCQSLLQITVQPKISAQPVREEKFKIEEPLYLGRLPYKD